VDRVSGTTLRGLTSAAALLVVLGVLAGCDSSPLPPAQSADSAPTRTFEAPVSRIDVPSPGEDDLVFTVEVPSGGPGCADDVHARVLDFDREALRLQTVVQSNQAPYCTKSGSRTFTERVALQGRTLVVNGQSWAPSRAGAAFSRCSAMVGCDPPDDRCAPVWTATLTPHFDLPPRKHATVVACSGRWLILDIDAVFAGSTAVRRRWFAELDAHRNWQVVASGTAAGCADVRRAVPSFPKPLCAGLPAR
jgi:hypothetical protein